MLVGLWNLKQARLGIRGIKASIDLPASGDEPWVDVTNIYLVRGEGWMLVKLFAEVDKVLQWRSEGGCIDRVDLEPSLSLGILRKALHPRMVELDVPDLCTMLFSAMFTNLFGLAGHIRTGRT